MSMHAAWWMKTTCDKNNISIFQQNSEVTILNGRPATWDSLFDKIIHFIYIVQIFNCSQIIVTLFLSVDLIFFAPLFAYVFQSVKLTVRDNDFSTLRYYQKVTKALKCNEKIHFSVVVVFVIFIKWINFTSKLSACKRIFDTKIMTAFCWKNCNRKENSYYNHNCIEFCIKGT